MFQGKWQYIIHELDRFRAAELVADGIVLATTQHMLDLIGDLYTADVDGLIVHEKNVSPAFFDLRSGLAGDILQKCSNYGFRLAVVGEFAKYESDNLQAFVRESNRGGLVRFAASVGDALRGGTS